MKRLMLVAVIAAIAAPTWLTALTKCYDVVPYKNCIAQTDTVVPNNRVSQYYRNTLDSLTVVSFWCGDAGDTSEHFRVEVRDSVSGELLGQTEAGGVQAPGSWSWMPCSLVTTNGKRPVRGRTYKITVSRQSGAAISFAYCDTNPYKYGCLVVGNDTHPTEDLALRVYGLHDAVTPEWWSFVPGCPWYSSGWLGTWHERMETLGVKRADFSIYWDSIESTKGTFDFDSLGGHDRRARWLHDSAECVLDARPHQCPPWVSSRMEPDSEMCIHCPPRNLFRPVSDSSEDSGNYWARFVRRTIRHYDALGDTIHIWTGWNEPNDTTTDTSKHMAGWWRRPNVPGVYDDLGTGARPLCSLYVRLCLVAESVIHHGGLTGHENDTFLIGSTCRVRKAGEGDNILVPGDTWIWMCYDIATRQSPGIFWNGVAVHPYSLDHGFDVEWYEAEAQRVREITREFGHNEQIWNQELGWWYNSLGEENQARNLAKAFVVTKGSEVLPAGGYDRMMWYTLLAADSGCDDPHQIVGQGPGFAPKAAFHAFAQLTHRLTGLRLNGRVMTGGTKDDSVRMYEFEDPATAKKTWVCWQNQPTLAPWSDVAVKLPARSDTAAATALDYGDDPPPSDKPAASTGWLPCTLTTRPVFVTEPTSMPISRPDLVLDRILVPAGAKVGSVMDIHAIVKNIGTDTTPDTVAIDFLSDDSVFLHATSEWPIAPGDSYDFSFEINPIPGWMHGWHLFSARVNPGQTYVEKDGMDDNCGYVRRYISYGPIGDLRGVVCGGHSNAPLPLLGLETYSMERDTTRQTPCESARIVQWWYGLNDTVVHSGDTTAWICANEAVSLDTSWQYLSGQGKYKMFLQVKDSWSMSDLIPDTTHAFVVFDTTGPTGSIVIGHGARFSTSSNCTLSLAASDSISGVAAGRPGRAVREDRPDIRGRGFLPPGSRDSREGLRPRPSLHGRDA
jgi:hypothetical protein